MVKEICMTDKVILTDSELVVTGYPVADDESHNCDVMGCGSCEHILLRIPITKDFGLLKGYNPSIQEKELLS